MKKESKSLKTEIEKLRKSNSSFENAKITSEKESSDFQEVIKFLMEFNEELVGRLKKDPSNPDFKNSKFSYLPYIKVWYKKKKIDTEMQKFKERKEAEKSKK